MKILVLQGPPACGKSTFAREFVKGKKDWVIVCRDSLRVARGDYWIEEQEDYITDNETCAIENALKHNLNVVIDATNLSGKAVKKWNDMAKKYHCEIEFKEFYVPFKVALERDKLRKENGADHSVGKYVLENFYKRYYRDKYNEELRLTDNRPILEPDTSLPPCVIFDLDGTCAIHKGRGAFEYDKVGTDLFDPRMQRIVQNYIDQGIQVFFFSGREDVNDCRQDTINWLNKHITSEVAKGLDGKKYPTYELVMRKYNDHRPDDIVKKELYEAVIKDEWDVMAVYDDRDKVVKMWRELGILCCQVYYGDF